MIQIPHWFKTAVLALGLSLASMAAGLLPGLEAFDVAQASPLPAAMTVAYLPPGNAITDGRALLRNALPIDNKEIRKIQENLEVISESLRSKRWGPIKSSVTKVEQTLSRGQAKILAAIPEDRQPTAQSYLDDLKEGLIPLREAIDNRDKEAVWTQRSTLLEDVSYLEELMVKEFPFEVPAEYSNLPQLKGRATIEFQTSKGNLVAVLDGYSAPVTAGNFLDLIQRGFYDGVEFTRAEDNYVLQTGDPAGPEDGFIDPKTKQYRAIPLEILVAGDDQPVYGSTLEDLGRFLDNPVLPFSAFGTLGMARPGNDVNGGSSQFFFFLFEPELTPAGLNLLDGRYSVFGYVVENKEVLEQLKQGDRIDKVQVLSGLENLVQPEA
ncbi:peptidylprolyl isomerase [Pseudanabaena sp. FACHB-2040]|uniref:peptidylprolyl isomerase n=1 Tax=Pseudanabaena sp. FACHB-2040 TaxID=2692859 RepID=UPI00168297C5|nr:peptidylprolyl isomerase [Pseudanabaena sp. FACHB-2040]MBD2257471.1 peptidylprolyl isomerase [Pseudanabaena sp. FACHB-2040]